MPVVNDYTALLSGSYWNGIEVTGTPVFITYSFNTAANPVNADLLGTAALATFQAFTPEQQAQAQAALAEWGDASGIVFIQVAAGHGEINFSGYDFSNTPYAFAGGVANFPFGDWNGATYPYFFDDTPFDSGGDVLMNVNYESGGLFAYDTLLHELGHALGFKHPTGTWATPGATHDEVLASDDPTLTVMSTQGDTQNAGDAHLKQLDIDAVQFVYGTQAQDGTQVASWSWDPTTETLTQDGYDTADVIRGVDVTDVINGHGGDDKIFALGGDDTVDGGAGNDIIYGGSGKDTITGGEGDDEIYGGTGKDVLDGGPGQNYIFGEDDNDRVIINTADFTTAGYYDYADGGTGNNILEIHSDNTGVTVDLSTNSVYWLDGQGGFIQHYVINFENVVATGAFTGVQTFLGDDQANVLQGGDEQDVFSGRGGDDWLIGGGGNDTFHGDANNDHLLGDAGNDSLYGDDGNDVLYGGDGNDLLDGGTGADSMAGNDGNDVYVFDNPGDYASEQPNQGTDEIQTSNAVQYLAANIENLTGLSDVGQRLGGNELDNVITGANGADNITGAAGADTIHGNGGNDLIYGDAGNDTIYGEAGNDIVYSGDGNDVVYGGEDNDILDGNNGDDTLYGGNGADRLVGEAGNDTLHGDAGNDILLGGDGNDTLDGGVGGDSMYGNDGNDVYIFDNPGDYAGEQPGQGIDEVQTWNPTQYLAANIENLTGLSDAGQRLGGNSMDNVITGGNGNDVMTGGDGSDIFFGSGGNDWMYGEAGNDTFRGGLGTDSYFGGAGNDTFVFAKADFQPGGYDVVQDFHEVPGTDFDTLELEGVASDYSFVDGSTFVRVIDHATGGSVYVYGASATSIVDQVHYVDHV